MLYYTGLSVNLWAACLGLLGVVFVLLEVLLVVPMSGGAPCCWPNGRPHTGVPRRLTLVVWLLYEGIHCVASSASSSTAA